MKNRFVSEACRAVRLQRWYGFSYFVRDSYANGVNNDGTPDMCKCIYKGIFIYEWHERLVLPVEFSRSTFCFAEL